MKKKIFALGLIVVLSLSGCGSSSQTSPKTTDTTIEDFKYSIDENDNLSLEKYNGKTPL